MIDTITGDLPTMTDLRDPVPLPDPGLRRWQVRDKQRVVEGVVQGFLSLKQACQTYRLSLDEFLAWRRES